MFSLLDLVNRKAMKMLSGFHDLEAAAIASGDYGTVSPLSIPHRGFSSVMPFGMSRSVADNDLSVFAKTVYQGFISKFALGVRIQQEGSPEHRDYDRV